MHADILKDADNQTATIQDIAPIVQVSAISHLEEFGQVHAIEFSAFDPGDDPIDHWLVDWGAGVVEQIPGTQTSAQHVYAQPGDYVVSVQAVDAEGVTHAPVNAALDSDFGDSGVVTTDFFGGDDLASGVVVQPDGKVIVSGSTHTKETILPGGEPLVIDDSVSISKLGTGKLYGEDFIPVDINGSYKFTATAFSGDGQGGSVDPAAKSYVGFESFDADQLLINTYMYYRYVNAGDTRLAVESMTTGRAGGMRKAPKRGRGV